MIFSILCNDLLIELLISNEIFSIIKSTSFGVTIKLYPIGVNTSSGHIFTEVYVVSDAGDWRSVAIVMSAWAGAAAYRREVWRLCRTRYVYSRG